LREIETIIHLKIFRLQEFMLNLKICQENLAKLTESNYCYTHSAPK